MTLKAYGSLRTAARELLLGMARYAHDTAQAWSLCRLPLSIRDKFGIEAVVEWAVRMKADAVIGQFYNTDNVGLFRENGIIAIAQDFKKRFTTIPNITGPHHLAGRMAEIQAEREAAAEEEARVGRVIFSSEA